MLRWRDMVILSGYMFALGLGVVLLITFLSAYFNGMRVVVTVNSFGEAGVELVLVPVLLCFSVLGLCLFLVDKSKVKEG